MNASNCQLLISFANFQAKCVNKRLVPALIYSFGLCKDAIAIVTKLSVTKLSVTKLALPKIRPP